VETGEIVPCVAMDTEANGELFLAEFAMGFVSRPYSRTR
jgi:hypothetical protein